MSIVNSRRKRQWVLLLIHNVLSVLRRPSDIFVTTLLHFLVDFRADLMPSQIARCFFLLAATASPAQQQRAFFPFLRSVHPISLEAALMHLAIVGSNPDGAFQNEFLPFANRFLNNSTLPSLPSFFCLGLRLFDSALSSLPETHLRILFKNAFDSLLANFVRFRQIFPIAETSGNYWIAILSNKTLSGFSSYLLLNLQKLMPDLSSPAFPVVSLCLPQMVELALNGDFHPDVTEKLLRISSELITIPPTPLMTRIFIKILGIRAERLPREERKAAVMSWLGNSFVSVDCYSLSELVFELCVTLLRLLELAELLPVLANNVFHRCSRFFPVFVGVLKFTKHRLNGALLPVMAAELRRGLAAAAEPGCAAHAKALALMLDPTQTRAALDLAIDSL
jgi:hypothetical protein